MDARMMDSGSTAFSSLACSSPFSSTNTTEQAATSSSNLLRSSAGSMRVNMPVRCGARIQTRIPGISVHSCVARIRAEDQHLAEDIIEGAAKDRAVMIQLASHVNEILLQSPKRTNPSPLGSSARGASPMVMLQC